MMRVNKVVMICLSVRSPHCEANRALNLVIKV